MPARLTPGRARLWARYATRRRARRLQAQYAAPADCDGLPVPPGSLWGWRPEAWRTRLAAPAAPASGTSVAADMVLFHDGDSAALVLDQAAGQGPPPHGVGIAATGFRGSFLSLAITLPGAGHRAIARDQLLRCDVEIAGDAAAQIYARLNVQNGPDRVEAIRHVPTARGSLAVTFDLACMDFSPVRVERIWLDLIFNDLGTGRVLIGDLLLSRQRRAAL